MATRTGQTLAAARLEGGARAGVESALMLARMRSWVIAALLLAAVPSAAAGTPKVTTRVDAADGMAQPGLDAGFSGRCPKLAPHPVGAQVYTNDGEGRLA